jgi:hypothetical protein
MRKNEEHEPTEWSLSTPVGEMVIFVIVFRFDVAVKVFVLVNGAGRARRLLSLCRRLERDLQP